MSFSFRFSLKDNLVSPLSKILDPTSHYRCTGRSLLFAKAFVVIAYRHPDEWITLNDHLYHDKVHHRRHMLDRVYDLVDFDRFENRFVSGNYQIKYKPKFIGEPLEYLFRNPDIVKDFGL